MLSMKKKTSIILFSLSSIVVLPLIIGEFKQGKFAHCVVMMVLFVLALRGLVRIMKTPD